MWQLEYLWLNSSLKYDDNEVVYVSLLTLRQLKCTRDQIILSSKIIDQRQHVSSATVLMSLQLITENVWYYVVYWSEFKMALVDFMDFMDFISPLLLKMVTNSHTNGFPYRNLCVISVVDKTLNKNGFLSIYLTTGTTHAQMYINCTQFTSYMYYTDMTTSATFL